MKNVSISLTDQHAAQIELEIASGGYASVSEVIRAALREYLDRPPGPGLAQIERDIDAFLAEQAAGARGLPADAAFAEIRARSATKPPNDMTPRALVLMGPAIADIARHGRVLARARGAAFAEEWVAAFEAWLWRHAELGAVIGTEHPRRPGLRTFGYRRQATLLAQYAEGEVRVVRVYFAGQDWRR